MPKGAATLVRRRFLSLTPRLVVAAALLPTALVAPPAVGQTPAAPPTITVRRADLGLAFTSPRGFEPVSAADLPAKVALMFVRVAPAPIASPVVPSPPVPVPEPEGGEAALPAQSAEVPPPPLTPAKPAPSAGVTLVVREARAPAALTEIDADRVARAFAKGAPGFKLENTGLSTVGGERAAVVTGALVGGAPEQARIRACHVAVSRKGRLYLFTLACDTTLWDEAAPAFLGCLETVKWLD